ncbi:mucin-2-like [Planococcus citri]|uniref:mucin-2-like n=1 Tax=Planococcus citri TaxID=170843 RepID=UPI0031F7299B
MSTIIYTITLQVLRLSVTRIIMFFVREQRVKIIGILLLLNVSWSLAELPASSYLPPNRNDQPSQFSSPNPTGQSYNANSAPIETSVSLTTSEPFSYNPSSFNADSGETRNPPSNTYGAPNSDRIISNLGGNNFNRPGDFNRGSPTRNQQSTGGNNNGYSYQQPNTLNAAGAPSGGQNYQSINPANIPQSNSFGSTGVSNDGQNNYQSAGPTNSPSGVSSSYFNSPAPSAISPTYGPPSNTSGGAGGNRGSNLLDRKPPAGLTNSFRPSSPSNQVPFSGNSQGSLPNLPGLSTNYLPPSTAGGSFNNFPPFGGSFNPSSNLFGPGSTPWNPNRNQYSSSGPINVPNGRPSSNFGPPSIPQTLYGPPTPNSFTNNARPSGNFAGSGPPQTLYNPPTPSGQTPDRFSSQSNQNKGTFGPPSPTYGPPANSPPFGGNSQSFRPQEFERFNQNSRPFDNSAPGLQNNSSPQRPSPSPLYGTPFSSPTSVGFSQGPTQGGPYSSSNGPSASISPSAPYSNTPNAGFSQGLTQEGPYSSSKGPSSSISPSSPFSNNPNVGYNQGPTQEGLYAPSKGPSSSISPSSNSYNSVQQSRPSSPFQSSSGSNPPQTGYPQRIQNQPQGLSSNYGSPPGQASQSPIDRTKTPYTVPSNSYQPPSQSFAGENSPLSSYLPPSLNSFSNPTGFGSSSNGAYEAPRSPTNPTSSNTAFATNGYEIPRLSTNTIPSGSSGAYDAQRSPSGPGFGAYEASRSPSSPGFGSSGGGYEAPKSPTNSVPSSLGFSTNGGGYEGSRSPTNSIPPRSSSPVNSLSPLYGTPSTNSFNQEVSSPNQQGYSSGPASSPGFGTGPASSIGFNSGPANSPNFGTGPAGSSGFGNIPSTTETPRPSNSNPLSPIYGTPTRDYTDAVIGDYNPPTSPDLGNTYSNSANTVEDFANLKGNTQPSQSPSLDRDTPAQSAYSAFSPDPSRLYSVPRPSTDLTSESNPSSFAGSGSTNSEPQSESNFGSPSSSYLPPSQSVNGAFSNDDIVPSTSYTLPSDQPSSSQPGASNTVKNVNRNVGSDLITGASTSPFLPFKDDSSKPNAAPAPSRATYEKSQEITSNDLTFSGYESVKPAKYQFNYDVKGSGPEFSHQESRNGSTTSGSYGVVLPDGRKQVVDYEANQEGFHPKIRYEETPNNSLQQNNDQNQGYNYSPSNPAQNYSSPSTQNLGSSNPGSSSNYPQTQSSYSSRPDYSIGTPVNQGSYTSPYDASSSPLGYPANNQGSEANFNTYSNQGTSPSNPDGSTFDSKPSNSQFDDNNGYDYTPGGNSNNQVSSFDSTGYPAAQNGPKQVPFYT